MTSTDEASALEVMGLEIEDADGDEGGLLLQPCRALKGKRCTIYPHRPDCCRTFECRLLQETKRGAVSVEQANEKIAEALKRIERVKALIVQLGPAIPPSLKLRRGKEHLPLKERCEEALAISEADDADPETKQKRDELESVMTSVERLIQETFLGRDVTSLFRAM